MQTPGLDWKQAKSREELDQCCGHFAFLAQGRRDADTFPQRCKTPNYPIDTARLVSFIFQRCTQTRLFTKPRAHACFQKLCKHSDTSRRPDGEDASHPSPPFWHAPHGAGCCLRTPCTARRTPALPACSSLSFHFPPRAQLDPIPPTETQILRGVFQSTNSFYLDVNRHKLFLTKASHLFSMPCSTFLT